MSSYSKMVYEKKPIFWPPRVNEKGEINKFTGKDVIDLNKGRISHVSIQAKINALINLGGIEIVGHKKTNGRPMAIYQFVGTFNPIPPSNESI